MRILPALGFATVLFGLMATVPANAQSLGEVARAESTRRASLANPPRVMTNADLTSSRALTIVAVPALAAAPGGQDIVTVARRVPASPALLRRGVVPDIPVMAVSGGEVMVEVLVDRTGRVVDVTVLRDTPAFTETVIEAIRGWQFEPAEDAAAPAEGQGINPATRRPVDSKVLVMGLFRPPAIFPTTLGQPPATVALPSEAVAAPSALPAMPLYPPNALFDGVVLTELQVDTNGRVADTRVLSSAPGLTAPTLDVLRPLTFRPARVEGLSAESTVYVVTAFRQPILQPRAR